MTTALACLHLSCSCPCSFIHVPQRRTAHGMVQLHRGLRPVIVSGTCIMHLSTVKQASRGSADVRAWYDPARRSAKSSQVPPPTYPTARPIAAECARAHRGGEKPHQLCLHAPLVRICERKESEVRRPLHLDDCPTGHTHTHDDRLACRQKSLLLVRSDSTSADRLLHLLHLAPPSGLQLLRFTPSPPRCETA